jgi:uncharacterized membrane protein YkvA (DUF1232 family)
MPLNVSLEISDDELDYFRSAMREVRQRSLGRSAAETAAAAAREVQRLRASVHSPFIRRRLERVDRLIAMLADPEWHLPDVERRRVLEGLAYVANTHDLVPDGLPVLGLLDDAIMLELVLRDLRHELESFEDFDAYRSTETARTGRSVPNAAVSRQDWLDARRETLHARMRERRERDLAGHGVGFELITHF